MATLKDVHEDVARQFERDFGDRHINEMRYMCALGLAEESGEVAGIMKRAIRNNSRDKGVVTREHTIEELGDVLWYLTACCIINGTTLDEVYSANVAKLKERYGDT